MISSRARARFLHSRGCSGRCKTHSRRGRLPSLCEANDSWNALSPLAVEMRGGGEVAGKRPFNPLAREMGLKGDWILTRTHTHVCVRAVGNVKVLHNETAAPLLSLPTHHFYRSLIGKMTVLRRSLMKTSLACLRHLTVRWLAMQRGRRVWNAPWQREAMISCTCFCPQNSPR